MSLFFNHQHVWVFLLALVALSYLAFRLYRRVPPAVSPGLRRTLLAIRIAAIAVIVFVLLEPVVRFTRTSTERPIVAVLLDTSRSMSISDGTGGIRRGDEAVSLLNEVVVPRVARDADVEAFGFADHMERIETRRGAIAGEQKFDGRLTDIAGAFTELRRQVPEALSAIVLATDGAANRGGSVLDAWRPLGVPVYSLGVGSEVEPKDIAIREALTNRISYAGEVLPIEVTLSSAGFAEGSTTVELQENGVDLDTATVELSETGEESVVKFDVVPPTQGIHRYTIVVPVAPGELSTSNNRRVVATNTLGGKVKVLMVASRPSWDYAFLVRELRADANMDLTSWNGLSGPSGAGGPVPRTAEALLSYDLVILVEPNWADLPFPAEWLARFVSERGGGLLVVGLPPGRGEGGDAAAILPSVSTRPAQNAAREARLQLTSEGEASSLCRVVDGRYDNASLWQQLPPVWTAAEPWWEPGPAATVLASASPSEGETIPVIMTSRSGGGSVALFAVSGIWRWKMAGPEEPDALDAVVANAARWLTARGELTRVTAETDKDVYSAGETVHLSAQVYGSDYRLARDASVRAEVSKGEGTAPVRTTVLSPDGDFYRGSVDGLTPGRYVYVAHGDVAGESMGDARGEFVVDEFSLEDAEIRRRPGLLRRLADDSGGSYVSP